MINRKKLQELTNIRLKETKTLLLNKNYDGAYYICGYIIELALKSCIAKQTRKHEFPDFKTVQNSYTHDLEKLLRTSGLEKIFENDRNLNNQLNVNWGIVKDWSENSRYERHSKKQAEDIFNAVSHETDGVLIWVKKYW